MASSAYSIANLEVKLQQLANQNTQKTFEYNAKEANTARTWQKMMSDTSHQREVEDLKKAGLNPVLSSGGSGAQSYTTSAASGTADSAVNALGNIGSTKIGSDAQVRSARLSAAATRYAADRSYAAAQAAASAQRYAADRHYAATRYQVDFGKSSSAAGVVRQVLGKALQTDTGSKLANSFGSKIANQLESTLKNVKPRDIFEGAQAKFNDFKLSALGFNKANSILKNLGVKSSESNRRTVIKAVYFNDKASQNILARWSKSRAGELARIQKYGLYTSEYYRDKQKY